MTESMNSEGPPQAQARRTSVQAHSQIAAKMFEVLYGSTAAGLYDQAAKLNAQACALYLQSSDAYYKANDAAAYDDVRDRSD